MQTIDINTMTPQERMDTLYNDECVYKNNDEYPSRSNFQADLDKELEEFVGTRTQYKEYEKERKEFYSKKLTELRDAYSAKTRELNNIFKSDLENINGIENNPKKELLWEKAWDRGHAHGITDVKSAYEDLIDLIL